MEFDESTRAEKERTWDVTFRAPNGETFGVSMVLPFSKVEKLKSPTKYNELIKNADVNGLEIAELMMEESEKRKLQCETLASMARSAVMLHQLSTDE